MCRTSTKLDLIPRRNIRFPPSESMECRRAAAEKEEEEEEMEEKAGRDQATRSLSSSSALQGNTMGPVAYAGERGQ
jgi:hypothetical protein